MQKLWKEVILGTGLAGIVILGLKGVDITPIFLIIGLAIVFQLMLTGQASGGRLEVMGSDTNNPVKSSVTFDDIGGQEVAKREFIEALNFIKEEEKCRELGIRPLKGILLVGPPGTGKTLLAKAAASYTDSAFVATSGSAFVEMYAGVGAQRVRQIFKKARQAAAGLGKKSAIVFIDEIEVLGGKRGRHTSHLEYDQTLNQLLVEMDGINVNDEVRILVVAATNRGDLLDPALLRPGRFDRVVKVDLPDKEGRLHILQIHAREKPLDPSINLEKVAQETFGLSGAHLESLLNEAAIHALRQGHSRIKEDDIREALEKIMLGEKLDRQPLEEEKRRIAYHETGHAVVSEIIRPNSVSTLTVIPRGRALGYMRQTPEADHYLFSQRQLLDQIAVCLAGAVVEEIFFGCRSTGSSGDFEQAVNLAQKMIYTGMSDLGVISKEHISPRDIHREVQSIIRMQEERVRNLIKSHSATVKTIAEQLLQKEKLSGELLRQLLAKDDLTPAANQPTGDTEGAA